MTLSISGAATWTRTTLHTSGVSNPGEDSIIIEQENLQEQGSNLRPVGPEPTALPLSYPGGLSILLDRCYLSTARGVG